MRAGVSFLEILLILTLIVVFVDPKQIPSLLQKSLKIAAQARMEVKKFLDEISLK
jgi:Sec-independent protein translocase protein TatA